MFNAKHIPGDDHPAGTDWHEELAADVDYRTAVRAVLASAADAAIVITDRRTDADGTRWFIADGGFNGAFVIARGEVRVPEPA